MGAPLHGIRVVEVANAVAAPAATRLMADLGAEVIKVEPPNGDTLRGSLPHLEGYEFPGSPLFELDNAGKRSITVDLTKAGGPALVQRLASSCDVFVSNMTLERRERYGLSFEDLSAKNPRIVYASLTAYGSSGPDRDRLGMDHSAFFARSGIMHLLGERDEPPMFARGAQGDHTTSLNLLAAVLVGLRQRDATGEPQHVEVTLQGTGIWTIGLDVSEALIARREPVRQSRRAPRQPLRNVYQCADGKWVLLVNTSPFPRRWPAFCEILGHPEWAQTGRWDSLEKLLEDSAELSARVAEVIATRDLAEWASAFDEKDIIWAPVASVLDVVDDPQVRDMGWIAKTESSFGPIETLNVPFKVHGASMGIRGPAPELGQDTLEILADLGIEGDELDRLATDGAIG